MSCEKHAAPPLFTCLEVPVLDMSELNPISGPDMASTTTPMIPINIRESALQLTSVPSTSKHIRYVSDFREIQTKIHHKSLLAQIKSKCLLRHNFFVGMFEKITQPFKVVFLFCAALSEDKVDNKVHRISLFQ